MSEGHPLMALLLEQNTFLGYSETIEEEIMPLPNQLDFGPGDCAILAGSNVPVEQDFALVKGLDPEKHAEEFPDWEERMLNSFVLVEIFSRADPEIYHGWVSRLKLMRIPKYRYKEGRKWMKDGFPEELPDWAHTAYEKYTESMAAQAPEWVPLAYECPRCGKKDVELVVVRTLTYRVHTGHLTRGKQVKFVPLHPPEEEDSHTAKLHCRSCDWERLSLEDDDWQLPNSN